jgi:hypothetical protein
MEDEYMSVRNPNWREYDSDRSKDGEGEIEYVVLTEQEIQDMLENDSIGGE